MTYNGFCNWSTNEMVNTLDNVEIHYRAVRAMTESAITGIALPFDFNDAAYDLCDSLHNYVTDVLDNNALEIESALSRGGISRVKMPRFDAYFEGMSQTDVAEVDFLEVAEHYVRNYLDDNYMYEVVTDYISADSVVDQDSIESEVLGVTFRVKNYDTHCIIKDSGEVYAEFLYNPTTDEDDPETHPYAPFTECERINETDYRLLIARRVVPE